MSQTQTSSSKPSKIWTQWCHLNLEGKNNIYKCYVYVWLRIKLETVSLRIKWTTKWTRKKHTYTIRTCVHVSVHHHHLSYVNNDSSRKKFKSRGCVCMYVCITSNLTNSWGICIYTIHTYNTYMYACTWA